MFRQLDFIIVAGIINVKSTLIATGPRNSLIARTVSSVFRACTGTQWIQEVLKSYITMALFSPLIPRSLLLRSTMVSAVTLSPNLSVSRSVIPSPLRYGTLLTFACLHAITCQNWLDCQGELHNEQVGTQGTHLHTSYTVSAHGPPACPAASFLFVHHLRNPTLFTQCLHWKFGRQRGRKRETYSVGPPRDK